VLYSVQNWGDLSEQDLEYCLNQFKNPAFISKITFLEKGIKNEMIELRYKLKWSTLFWFISLIVLITGVLLGNYTGYIFTCIAIAVLIIRMIYSYTRSLITNQLYLITKDKPHCNY
jgi:hypothetical protein